MDPTLFGPGSFMGRIMGLAGRGQQQGQNGDGSVPVPPQQPQGGPGFFGRLAQAAFGGGQPAQPGYGANMSGVEGSPGASVPMPPPRPNPGQDLQTQGGDGGGIGLWGGGGGPSKNQVAGANQIVNALGGLNKQATPAQFAPMPQQQHGPMQLPPMNLGGM